MRAGHRRTVAPGALGARGPRAWSRRRAGGAAATAIAVIALSGLASCGGSSSHATSTGSNADGQAAASSVTTGRAAGATAGGSSAPAPASSAAPATTATTGAPSVSADTAAANTINFIASDFPSGWSSTPNSGGSGSGTTSQDEQVAACAGAPDPKTAQEIDVSSDDFSNSSDDASSDVTVIKTAALARQDLTAIQSDRALACFRQLLPALAQSQAPSGTQLSVVSVARLAVPNYGDGSFGIRVVINVTQSGSTVAGTVDDIGFVKGRLEISGDFTGLGSIVPPDLEQALMAKLAARAAATTA
jgi:hypothetical protein